MSYDPREVIVRGARRITSKVLPAILSGVGHGSHLCAFYETKEDLIDLVLPFFDAGSNQGELCVWCRPGCGWNCGWRSLRVLKPEQSGVGTPVETAP